MAGLEFDIRYERSILFQPTSRLLLLNRTRDAAPTNKIVNRVQRMATKNGNFKMVAFLQRLRDSHRSVRDSNLLSDIYGTTQRKEKGKKNL